MPMSESRPNGLNVPEPSNELQPTALQNFKRKAAWSAWLLILSAIALSLSGCRTQPTQPCEPLPPALKPVLRTPLPKVSYSILVQEDLSMWQQKLTATSVTSKP